MRPLSKSLLSFLIPLVLSLLSACATTSTDRVVENKVEQVVVTAQVKEAINKLVLIYVRPKVSASDDPKLVQGYELSGLQSPGLLVTTAVRSAEFLSSNGVNTVFGGSIDDLAELKTYSEKWVKDGHLILVFLPEGYRTTLLYGKPSWSAVRYRALVLNRAMVPLIQFLTTQHLLAPNSSAADNQAAGWLTALIENGFVARQGEAFTRPPFRDFRK